LAEKYEKNEYLDDEKWEMREQGQNKMNVGGENDGASVNDQHYFHQLLSRYHPSHSLGQRSDRETFRDGLLDPD